MEAHEVEGGNQSGMVMTMAVSVCDVYHDMVKQTDASSAVHNYTQLISMKEYTVETELFSKDILEAYSSYNLEKPIRPEHQQYFSEQRGGKQGDYRQGMRTKLDNVIDSLRCFPESKRAVLTICNNPIPHHSSDDDAKCMREIHFWIDQQQQEQQSLNATVLFRAQAAQLFPKNIHFIGSAMDEVCRGLEDKGLERGNLFYHATILVADRS